METRKENRRYAAVVSDMDGLLIDSERIALATFRNACVQFGLGDEFEVFRNCIGKNKAAGDRVLREGLGEKVDPVAFDRAWKSQYLELTNNQPVPLKAGAAELLQALHSAGIPVAIATSSSTQQARHKLGNAGLLETVKAIVGGDQVERSKPDPDIFLRAAAALGVDPCDCLALEDSENGVRAAVAAGMQVVQVPDLVEPSADLLALGHRVEASLMDVMKDPRLGLRLPSL